MKRNQQKNREFQMKIQICLMLAVCVCLCQTAAANTIHVCQTCPHTTIASAVNDAASGDSIVIAAGRYTENVTVEGKSLSLMGATGGANGVTEVYAAKPSPVFTLGSGVAGATPELIEMHNLVIAHGNHAGGTGVGGGVQVRAGAYLHLYDSVVTQNLAIVGGGIGVNSPGAPQTLISACLIDDNSASGTYGNGPWGVGGGGVWVSTGSSVSIQASTITRNVSTSGAGIFTDTGTQLSISNSVISNNTANRFHTHYGGEGGDGGGVLASGSLSISGSSFINNVANTGDVGGGGLFIEMNPGDTHTISQTIFAHNFVPGGGDNGYGGGIAAFNPSASPYPVLTLDLDYVVENSAPLGAGGIWANNVTLALTNTTVKDNVGGQICTNSGCN